MYRTIDLYSQPRSILKFMKRPCAEMMPYEHDFLCGLIKMSRPQKVVEIGVAGGGTTAVIQNCIEILGLSTEFYSIDLNKEHYWIKGEKTGYLYQEVSDKFSKQNHKFYLGSLYADVAEEIGGDIDFLILDTVHFMPGEFLDFLYALPYLTKNAIVVFHDVSLGLINCSDAICNKLLFDSITGDKYWDITQMEKGILPNIAAVQLNQDTLKSIEKVFSALSINWNYMPDFLTLRKYENFYKKYYSKECLHIFDAIIVNQIKMFYKKKSDIQQYLSDLREEIKETSLFIYGAGRRGRVLKSYLETNRIGYKGFVVSDEVDVDDYRDGETNIYHLSDISKSAGKMLVAAADCSQIILSLYQKEYDFLLIPEVVWTMWEV